MSRFRPSLVPLESRDTPASAFTASGAIAGGLPLVEVVAAGGAVLTQFQAFESSFTGGVRADTGELDGNPATVEVAVGAGPGGGPRVQVWAVRTDTGAATKIADFFAYEDTFRDGVRVAVGDVDGSAGGLDQVIVGTDPGGGPRVRAFRLGALGPVQLETPLGNFLAFEPEFRGGVRVAAGELDGNLANGDELAVAAGPGGGPRVRIFRGDGTVFRDFFAADPATTLAGVNVAFDEVTGTLRTDFGPDDFSQRSDRLNAPIRAAALAPALSSGFGTTTGFSTTTDGFTFNQNGGSTVNPVTGAFGTTQTSNLGAFGTTQTSNQGAFGTTQTSNLGAFGTTQTSNLGAFGTTQTSNIGAFGTNQASNLGAFGTGGGGTGVNGGTGTTTGTGATAGQSVPIGNTMTF